MAESQGKRKSNKIKKEFAQLQRDGKSKVEIGESQELDCIYPSRVWDVGAQSAIVDRIECNGKKERK
jgi:hypothetical protein